MEFFGDDLDYPYRLLELNKIFTLDQLKSQYKKMVLRYHPDKNMGDVSKTEEFRIITGCYKYLLQVYKQIHCEDKYVNNLDKINFFKAQQEYERQNPLVNQHPIDSNKIREMNQNFDVKRFNQVYDENKYNDPLQSAGYSDYELDTYLKELSLKGDVIESSVPQPLDGVDLADCYELGGKHQNLGRTKAVNKGLDFMDYKMAHTAQILDENKISQMSLGKKQYKTLEELKAERSAPIQFSLQDKKRMEQQIQEEKQKELERVHLMNKQKKDIEEYYKRTQSLLLR